MTAAASRPSPSAAPSAKFDPVHCKEALALLCQRGDVVEVRIPGTNRGVVSGYYDNSERLVADVARMSGEVAGVYITMNPVAPGRLRDSQNRLTDYARKTTGDKDILSIRWLLLDFDPQRPSGISSTDGEHEKALLRAREVQGYLREQGWPEPIYADSGNGAHLLYLISLPNDKESQQLVDGCLKALASRFCDEGVTVDPTVGNPSRIVKLYGTLACKGAPTPERPHRLARIVDAPDSGQQPVSGPQLQKLAALHGTPAGTVRAGSNGRANLQPDPAIGAVIVDGKRNSTLASIAGSMQRRGMEPATILIALNAENIAKCNPPLPEAEVAKIAASVARYEPAPQLSANGPPSVSATATEVLDAAGLRDLAGKSINEIVAVLRQVAEQLKTADGDALLRAAVRDEAVARLKNAKVVSSPTHLVDSALKGLTAESEEKDRQGQALLLTDPEPWPDPVDGTEVLADLQGVVKRYVVLPEGGATATALWAQNTYVHDASEISPCLGIVSPEKRCGKTTLLILLGQQVLRPVPASNISPASLFRTVEEYKPTLIIDEAETFLNENEELRGILNAGHHRANAYVIRTVGDDHKPRFFSTWCPKAFALIGRLPDTLEDRSIVIPMRRRAAGETVERLRLDRLDLEDLRRKCARWAADHLEELGDADPEMPDGLSDRAADNWRPLLAIADLVGGDWPTRAREAAKELSGSSRDGDGDGSTQTLLLEDLRDLFKGTDRLSSEKIVEALVQKEDRPWPEWRRGQPITQRGVAKLLEPFGVRPKQLWLDDKKRRGYEKAEFKDVWERYLAPPSPETPVTSGRTGRNVGGQQVTPDEQAVGDESSTGYESPVSRCGTTVLPDLPVRDPQNHHVPADSKGEAEWEVVL
jgi:putative DNA primase/helicase